MENLNYITLESMPAASELVAELIYDAWKPAINVLFEKVEALDVIHYLMEKDASELAKKNIDVLCNGNDVVGATVALDMAALKAAVLANLAGFMHMVKDKTSFLQKFETFKSYTVPSAINGTYLSKFVVVPAYRGRGLGEKLMEYFLATERAKKTQTIYLMVHRNNDAAMSLYKKFLFAESEDTRADTPYIIMKKKLSY